MDKLRRVWTFRGLFARYLRQLYLGAHTRGFDEWMGVG